MMYFTRKFLQVEAFSMKEIPKKFLLSTILLYLDDTIDRLSTGKSLCYVNCLEEAIHRKLNLFRFIFIFFVH